MIAAALVAILVTTVPPGDDIDMEAFEASFTDWALESLGVEVTDVECSFGEGGLPPHCVANTPEGQDIYAETAFPSNGDFVWTGRLLTDDPVPLEEPSSPDTEPSFPDTELGRAAQECLASGTFGLFDDGLSVLVFTPNSPHRTRSA